MPSQQSRDLFLQLKSDFGHLPRWEAFTREHDFEGMSEHEAVHYLCYLLAAFPHVRVRHFCRCGKRFYVYEPTKHPAVEQPGVSADHAV
jgi:hypothetical protein